METIALSADRSGGQAPVERRPLNPYLVLLAAILLPGFGHVLNGRSRRGLTLQFFMITFAFITWHLAPSSASLIGKLSGGLFIYALTLPEAFRDAKLRAVAFAAKQSNSAPKSE